MPRKLYALLVGIDRYKPPVPPLGGCCNDIDAFAAYLKGQAEAAGSAGLSLKVLKDKQATHAAIVAGFRKHLAKAKKGDVALFYYAGHGSQEQSPPEFWHLEPDLLDETLVCHDSREPGKFDLADKELAALIDEVAEGGAHVAVILDCCHSGSGTRNLVDRAVRVRRAPTDTRVRRVGDFDLTETQLRRLMESKPKAGAASAWPVGRHLLLAACRDDQEASEYSGDGEPRGAFSFFLGDTLRKATGPLTYRDVFARTDALLRTQVTSQCPQMEATSPEDLDALFLDGAIRPSHPYYLVSSDGSEWTMSAGSVHGVPAVSEGEAIELALFPFDAPAEALGDRSKAVGKGRVMEVGPTTSRVDLIGMRKTNPTTTYKAVVTALPLPALAVLIEGEAEGAELARAALAEAGPGGSPSLDVREAKSGESADFRLLARKGQYLIARSADDRPIVGQLDGYTEANAQKAIARLEHIARWSTALRLANPTSSIRLDRSAGAADVEMTILQDETEIAGPEIRLSYELKGGKWVRPEFLIRLRNNGDRRLYVALLNLTETFAISAALQDGGSIALDPGQEAWAYRKRPIPATIPDELWRQGVVELKDVLKLIACTSEFDARLMQQPALDLPRPEPTRSAIRGGLNRLLQRVQTRRLGEEDAGSLDDWSAASVVFTTVRPPESTPVPAAGSPPAKLAGGVKLHGHPKLRAKARLTAAPTASRDLGNLALPAILRDDPTISRPFVLAPTRSGSPGLSVLELTDVADPAVVTPEEPLVLDVPAAVGEGEHVLPVGFDGEFFLPLGRVVAKGGSSEVVLDRLPTAQPSPALPEAARRSLTGSIKIFFQKVTSGILGKPFEYPILAAADVDDRGGQEHVTYEKDAAKVRARVKKAGRILLLIHGVIGDTLELRRGMRRSKLEDGRPLDSVYDLVLTLDYENLNTPIEQVARDLKARLEGVGLGPDHGKELTIVAHSMGGLVARRFIEREGGNKVVRKLVMCGTPNGGSPWPGVHDWAIATLAIGLNGLATVVWPSAILGGLVASLERVDVNLDQMQPGSGFLVDLTHSTDPGVPYLMVSGDTSLARSGLTIDKAGLSPVGRLLARVLSKPVLHAVGDTLFRDVANDVAVSVASMKDVPGPWSNAYDVRPVACDHMSYFRHPAGLEALAKALTPD